MSKPIDPAADPPIFAEDDGEPPLPATIPWRGIAHLLVCGVLVYYLVLRGFVLRADNALGVLFDFVSGVCVLAIPVCFLLAMVARRQGKQADPALEEPMIRWGVRITAVVLVLGILASVARVAIDVSHRSDKVPASESRHPRERETGRGDLALAADTNAFKAKVCGGTTSQEVRHRF